MQIEEIGLLEVSWIIVVRRSNLGSGDVLLEDRGALLCQSLRTLADTSGTIGDAVMSRYKSSRKSEALKMHCRPGHISLGCGHETFWSIKAAHADLKPLRKRAMRSIILVP
jgi:hypothetical protein